MAETEPKGAIERWRSALAGWAIPQSILDAAPESPWGFSPRTFVARAERALAARPTPSTRRAAEALPEDGAVLDVGCGGGAASLPLLDRAAHLVAVDTDPAMLEALRPLVPPGCRVTLVEGRWPDVATEVPRVDVAVCNHVAYNMPDLDAAVARMTEVARRRVVLEMTREHPLSILNFLWPRFWDVERPRRPHAADAAAVVREAGLSPVLEEWTPDDLRLGHDDVASVVAMVRRSLCLDEARDADIEAALAGHLVERDGRVGFPATPLVTLWWDVPSI